MSPSSPSLIALLLRQWRVARHLTQEQLAELADVSVRAISNIERGINAAPQRATIRALADALRLQGAERAHFVGAVRRLRGASGATHAADLLRPAPLRVPLTPLIGREHLEAAAVHLLGRPTVRCLTLTGPLGIGKTRLAIQVASALTAHFAEGVAVVPLGEDAASASLPEGVLRHLGVTGCHPADALARLGAMLHDHDLLLVCDGCDSVRDAAAHLAALLATTPGIKVLVTSRAPLGISGEQELAVTPLALPPVGALTDVDIEQFGAVSLLLYHLRATRPDFTATPAQLATIVDLCRHLDGHPLALELVAARTRVLALHELRAYLTPDAGLEFLSLSGSQPSLRATIASGFATLSVTARALFRGLSGRSGTFTVAEVSEAHAALPRAQVVADIEALRAQGFIIAAPAQGGGVPAFTMLRVFRWFGATLPDQGDGG